MNRLNLVTPEQATGKTSELFSMVKSKLGTVPNMMRALGNSPAALESYLTFSGILSHGTLDAKVREQIALITAEENSCEYCLAAHSLLGKKAGLTDAQVSSARRGEGQGKTGAALALAREIIKTRGAVSNSGLEAARSAGLGDAEIAEVVANVSLNIFTNYFNQTALPEVDFPAAAPLGKQACCS